MIQKITVVQLSCQPLYQIASLILYDWKHPYFGAKPYIDAMKSMTEITDNYYQDPGPEIVARFLGNASTWHGEIARKIKIELNRRLKET